MKKFFLSLIAVATLFSACSSDDVIETPSEAGTGTLKSTITFSETMEKAAAASQSIPVTSWANVKQVQIFLYGKTGADDGKVAFSRVLDASLLSAAPNTGVEKTFTWANVPVGTYRLAIVANAVSNATGSSVQPKVDGNNTAWTQGSVGGKVFGNGANNLYLGYSPATFPAPYLTSAAYVALTPANKTVPYAVPTEIFSVYEDNVVISQTATAEVGGGGNSLKLKREVALLRTRIDVDNPTIDADVRAALATVDFDNVKNFMLLQRLPDGMSFKTNAFAGGSFAASTDKNVMVAVTGDKTFNKVAPPAATHSFGSTILSDGFDRWNEFVVFPNGPLKTTPGSYPAEALDNRKYTIILSAVAPAGYKDQDGKEVPAGGGNVYWSGTVLDVFSPNIIRELQIILTTKGSIDPPVSPAQEGKLIINIGTPMNWDGNIQTTTMEI